MESYLLQRHAGYKQGIGEKIMQGTATLVELEQWAVNQGEPKKISGRQELRENLFNHYITSRQVK